jgi:hypothetical protein
VRRDLDSSLLRAGGVTRANVPEATVTADLVADLAPQEVTLTELHLDRAYLSSTLVQQRDPQLTIFCRAWPVRQGPHVAKTAFHLDWARGLIQCPGQVQVSFVPGGVVPFPAQTCAVCPLRPQCTEGVRCRRPGPQRA